MGFVGELIALITVLCWTVSIQFFGVASREVGSTAVNIVRITLAVVFFGIFLQLRDGVPYPLDFPVRAWWLLGLSGVVGFFIGDIFLFKALVVLGPRLAMLLHSMAAPAAAVIGWLLLDEVYDIQQWLGILVTISGVALVILERNPEQPAASGRTRVKISPYGVFLGIGAMAGQAGGFVLSKAGMQSGGVYLDAFGATQIRAIAALCCFFLFFSATGKWGNVRTALDNRKAMAYTAAGSFVGPFLGVALSLLTLHYLTTGVASTILSLVPICIIPFSIYLHKEHVSLRAVMGAFIAVGGIVLLVN